jgi:hypothetical protein
MKSILSLTAISLLCASTSFAQQAPTKSEILLGQSGQATVDGQAMFGAGLSGAAVAGIVAAVVVVGAAVANANDDKVTTSTTGTN